MEKKTMHIPLMYFPEWLPEEYHPAIEDKILPSRGIRLEDITGEELDVVFNALKILEKNKVYFFKKNYERNHNRRCCICS